MRRLLIVDDDEAMRRLLRMNLADSYEIVDTADPEQAMALVMEHKPDAILMDLQMPKRSGFDLCRALGAVSNTAPIPIFVVSGETGAEARESCREMGVTGYFEKPVDFEALRNSLEMVERQTLIPRTEVRVQVRINLKLRGKDINEKEFDETTSTENVSISAFMCGCAAALQKDSIVDVYIVRGLDKLVGKARMVRSEPRQNASTLYAFRFVEKTGEWILK
jgi:DNA-binding response OmpR family regulator